MIKYDTRGGVLYTFELNTVLLLVSDHIKSPLLDWMRTELAFAFDVREDHTTVPLDRTTKLPSVWKHAVTKPLLL